MRVVVWRGCSVVSETEYPGTHGPDIHLDPWNLPESVGVRRPGNGDSVMETSQQVNIGEVAR